MKVLSSLRRNCKTRAKALEFLPIYLAVRKCPTVRVAKLTTQKLKKIIIPQANGDGLDIIVPGDVKNVLREATKVLRYNKIFATQCDEKNEWRPDRMLNVLCKRTGAVLFLGFLPREAKNRYKLLLHRVPDEGDEPVNVRSLKPLEQYNTDTLINGTSGKNMTGLPGFACGA